MLRFVIGLMLLIPMGVSADSLWLYGIHWYGPVESNDVETMTGGKGIWVLETAIGRDTSQAARFAQIVAKGHTIILRIQPAWGLTVPRPEHLGSYLDDVTALAQTYANSVHIWQVGNEMNMYLEYEGTVLSAAYYVNVYKQVRQRIKAVASPLGPQIVLVGPVSPAPAEAGVRHTEGTAYLSSMCEALTAPDTDGFAIHAYAAPQSTVSTSRSQIRNTYAAQLAVIDAKGFAAKGVYMTEWNRKVDPIDAVHEAQSAQTLWGALADLHVWNTTPGNHPVVCACWFIYPEDEQLWTHYSIGSMRIRHAPGANNDLYDAFKYACTQNYPAGNQFLPPTPTITPTPTQTPTVTQTRTSTPTPTPRSVGAFPERFDTMPVWSSTYDAAWGAAAHWSIVGGASGNYLQVARSAAGSSVRTLACALTPGTRYMLAAQMRCPTFGDPYWMEFGFRLGSHPASDFDQNPPAWTIVQKFASDGSNGNGNQWQRFALSFESGGSSVVTVGFKFGTLAGTQAVGWDTLEIAPDPLTPTPSPSRTATVTWTPTPRSENDLPEHFETMPAWHSTFYAWWGEIPAWHIAPAGEYGNHLRGTCTGNTTAANVIVYRVLPNTAYTLSIAMRCPAFSGEYWMESAYRLGEYSAEDFDQNPGQWTLVKKFQLAESNGNENVWMRYLVRVDTQSATKISVGFKFGNLGRLAMDVGWDTLTIEPLIDTPTPVIDADGDAIPDNVEGWPALPGQSSRYLPDSDGDGLEDGDEDTNRNGVRDAGETDTRRQDSDGDGAQDGIERWILRTDPLNPAQPPSVIDHDGDGLPQSVDLNDSNPDSDADRYLDGYEAAQIDLSAAYDPITMPALGDTNRDGFISNVDALIVQSIFLDLVALDTVAVGRADPNVDGLVSNVDALVVQSFFLRVVGRLPVWGGTP